MHDKRGPSQLKAADDLAKAIEDSSDNKRDNDKSTNEPKDPKDKSGAGPSGHPAGGLDGLDGNGGGGDGVRSFDGKVRSQLLQGLRGLVPPKPKDAAGGQNQT